MTCRRVTFLNDGNDLAVVKLQLSSGDQLELAANPHSAVVLYPFRKEKGSAIDHAKTALEIRGATTETRTFVDDLGGKEGDEIVEVVVYRSRLLGRVFNGGKLRWEQRDLADRRPR